MTRKRVPCEPAERPYCLWGSAPAEAWDLRASEGLLASGIRLGVELSREGDGNHLSTAVGAAFLQKLRVGEKVLA